MTDIPALPALPLSVLDVAPVGVAGGPAQAVQTTLALAVKAEELGFTRFWVAEHHGMPGIASSAPAVLISAIAAATRSIRVGSGGVMLPNHAPLVIAEQFGTLGALYPGRIDLGLGRAPGTDPRTAAALRRGPGQISAEDFPQQLGELACFLAGEFPDGHPYQHVGAVPHAAEVPPIWLLGSSDYSAQLAGLLGLPFAFAHHFSGANTLPALQIYRDTFRPSAGMDEPYAMVTVQVVCAEDDAAAERLALPSALSFLRLRQGHPTATPTIEEAETYPWTDGERRFVADRWANQAIGGPETVAEALRDLLKATAADELMVTTQVQGAADRLRSLERTRELFGPAALPIGIAAAGALGFPPIRLIRQDEPMSWRRRSLLLTGLVTALLALTACTATSGSHGVPASPTGDPAPTSDVPSSGTTRSSTAPTPPTTSAAVADAAHRVFAAMSEQQRVGQLFMVGATSGALDPGAVAAINDHFVGSVILDGNNSLSIAQQAAIDSQLQSHAGAARLFIATDQEGGEVRRLTGPGFSNMPSALVQGGYAPAALQADAKVWGSQLAAAGINLDLAPVMDTVPSAAFAPSNAPIGAFDREFGYSPQVVATHGTAVLKGLLAAGVDSTIKHFPGLGRVTANTDTSADVTDTVTTRTDPYLAPFAAGINAGTPFVMMSTAIYSRIDAHNPAAFSSTIVTRILRGDLHFGGVIISDDLGAAQQVASYGVGQRAVDFIAAGGDLVLTIEPSQIAAMTVAVLARAKASPAFAAQVNAAALSVLEAKAKRGLLG